MPDLPVVPETIRTRLFARGEQVWQRFRHRRGGACHAFVPADYAAAHDALRRLRPHADSFLELGSGVGVIAITAALLGYDAAGIEIVPWLVDAAADLADEFVDDIDVGSGASIQFAAGTFIPTDFQDVVDRTDAELPTIFDGTPAYDELGRSLADFDVVYAFPWPGLEDVFFELMARHGRPGGLFLTHSGTDGFQAFRDGVPVTLA